ncbi:MAG TPA: glycoside hydrolase family 127 protein [Acidobacteriota bacterium]|nr:glycoside hydrolase family 127 protein [Acidobacteriota bacterium]
MSSVRLTGGPLKNAQDLDGKYLLELEPDRMLAFLRERAGLKPKAKGYGGWDGPGRQLTGHIAGHYLSAVSLMWAATGDTRFRERVDYMVGALKEIQDKQGDGYLGALMDSQGVEGKVRFLDLSRGVIRSGGFDLNGLWSPWYVEHKIFAGLRDAYRYTGNRTALEVEIQFAAWAEGILSTLDHAQIQKMLDTEFGGMNEVAADLYADTGDKRWLVLSDKFEHRAVVDPLAAHEDILAHKHGNTQVPKLLGELMRYIYTGNESDGNAARFFWNRVALHHSFATGGHGKNEYFGPPDRLNDMVDGRTAESCNVYNMVKMTRALFSIDPDVRYPDFQERALFNHVLASMDPEDGRTCYMVPVGRGVQHEYQDMFQSFTCCVGTGMESHALHGYGIYYEAGDRLWVNLYIPTTVDWQAAGVKLGMLTDLPEGQSAALTLSLEAPRKFTLLLRRPYWAGAGFSVSVDGKSIRNLPAPDHYVELNRTWKNGDKVELVLPKALREEPLPDNPCRMALMWGPLVLAGDLGPEKHVRSGQEEEVPPPEAPVFVTANKTVEVWLKAAAGKPGSFRTEGVGLGKDINFVPFYRLPRRKYGIYWDVYTPREWRSKSESDAAEQEKQKKLEASTVAFVQPGQAQAEHDFNLQGEDTARVLVLGHHGRRAAKWFSLDVPVDPSHPVTLVATYSNDERWKRTFDVLVDGRKVAEQITERRSPEQDIRFFDVDYTLPQDLVRGKPKVTVRFQAVGESETGTVFGMRTIRADAPR